MELVDGTERFEVYYKTDSARFTLKDVSGIGWGLSSSNEIEVLGNIHEHPHLLEGE